MSEQERRSNEADSVNRPDQAVSLMAQQHNCAQAICVTYGPALGLSAELARRVAGGLGGGVARQGDVCGAVSGAVIVLGLRHQGERDPVYGAAEKFVEQFQARHGSINCCRLLGHDVSTPEGLKQARESGAMATICPGLVRSAAEILEMLL